jgi:hypothetical protein
MTLFAMRLSRNRHLPKKCRIRCGLLPPLCRRSVPSVKHVLVDKGTNIPARERLQTLFRLSF